MVSSSNCDIHNYYVQKQEALFYFYFMSYFFDLVLWPSNINRICLKNNLDFTNSSLQLVNFNQNTLLKNEAINQNLALENKCLFWYSMSLDPTTGIIILFTIFFTASKCQKWHVSVFDTEYNKKHRTKKLSFYLIKRYLTYTMYKKLCSVLEIWWRKRQTWCMHMQFPLSQSLTWD